MSRQLITEYRSELDRIHSASGSKRESVVREAFKDLLKRWGKSRDLIFLAEHEYIPPAGNRCYIDGALVHSIRVPFGYWEAKDTSDVLDDEIRKKTAKGYPRDNIIYEDTATAVLIQNKREVARAPMGEPEFEDYIPVANGATKSAQTSTRERAIFKLYSLGISTNRDEWVYDKSREALEEKMRAFIDIYDATPSNAEQFSDTIKWSRNLKRRLAQRRSETFDPAKARRSLYRPFSKRWLYQSSLFIDEQGSADAISPVGAENRLICFTSGGRLSFTAFAAPSLPSLTVLSLDGNQCLPRYRYTKSGERVDNITDWALNKFTAHYGKKAGVTKDAIFAYCYAILHDPLYREKYALNLKREFPRIPFYDDFAKWAEWGQALLDLHIGYEQAKPFKITRIDTPNPKRAKGSHPKPKLKSDPESGVIVVDEDTQLTGIPPAAWTYRLGNRSAIDWVLDQHKEKTPRDPTIRAKFNTYRFADHKDEMIKLLAKVVTVSLATVKITEAMRNLERTA